VRNSVIELIFEIVKDKNAFDKIENEFANITKPKLSENIIECGILPEAFNHDSSEEKLWAKYSDIILAKALTFLEIPAEVLRARGNSADVFGKAKDYSVVGDAKTFRLSRTAKNQKDFKIKSLDDWRKANNYALLVAPLTQYPQRKSQIYEQAIDKNVTLISYTHLSFLLNFHQNNQNLKLLWETGNRLKNQFKVTDYQNSTNYWAEIDKIICEIVNQNETELQIYKNLEIQKTQEIGQEGINFWQDKIKEYTQLSQAEAVTRLIKSEKIDTKIKTIQKAIQGLEI
jgi:type II restriction enzyme